MKKKLLALFTIFALAGSSLIANADSKIDILPLFSSQSAEQNRVWVGTFQLVWNDLMNDVVKGKVEFSNGTSELADGLNKQEFKADMISENSYYKAHGVADKKLKKTIKKALKTKFNESSDIIDNIDWNSHNYLLYAMLKKDFQFVNAFDKLKPAKFGNSDSKVEYFGIESKGKKNLGENIDVLFYNSPSDFALALLTRGNDVVYLYRTDDDKSFDLLYSDMKKKDDAYDGNHNFGEKDRFKVPDINLYGKQSFEELSGKHIKGTNFVISQALETIDFKMNNEGVKLKSEAAIIMKMTMLRPESEPRIFNFNDTFILFLQESDKDMPYFAMRINDVNLINSTAKK